MSIAEPPRQTTTLSTNFHEDVFYEYFRPFRHPNAAHDIWGGHGLETFGADLELVRRFDPEYVWTVLDGEADQWIVPGYCFVNRICYLLTLRPHGGAAIAFRVSRSGHSLTSTGLSRRVANLRRLLRIGIH